MKNRILLGVCSLLCSTLMLNSLDVHAEKDSVRFEAGKKYFRTYCSSCHSVHQEIYGPMLGSISKKKEERWLIDFIHNSQQVIKSGDTYAEDLFQKFNNWVMPAFEYLTDNDIRSILYYLKIESMNSDEHINDAVVLRSSNSNVVKGKQEFLEHCSTCHFIHKESTFAPALGSVTKRHSREWLISFIQHSQKKIQEGDPYAQHLFNQFDQHVMTSMSFLSIEEIDAILNYIEYASTIDASYKGKINNIEHKRQAAIQIKEVSSSHSVMYFIYLTLILIALLSALFVLLTLQSFVKYQTNFL